jgi:hypothetical protein
MHQLLQIQEGSFICYVTCPECSEVYKYDCIETSGSTKRVRTANHVVLAC